MALLLFQAAIIDSLFALHSPLSLPFFSSSLSHLSAKESELAFHSKIAKNTLET
jgi:hypothetical protein